LIEKAKHKVNRAAHTSFKPTKDSHGNNIKCHFGTWKYFVNKIDGLKTKYYITNECKKVPQKEGIKLAKKEEGNKKQIKDQIR
jgi:hypothetical protein